jgi:hypothetical protein
MITPEMMHVLFTLILIAVLHHKEDILEHDATAQVSEEVRE